jgi:hypothetical protein
MVLEIFEKRAVLITPISKSSLPERKDLNTVITPISSDLNKKVSPIGKDLNTPCLSLS